MSIVLKTHMHSIIRSKTKLYDSVPELIKKVKAIFYDREILRNFQSNFMPPKTTQCHTRKWITSKAKQETF